jgi:hypothetical protein
MLDICLKIIIKGAMKSSDPQGDKASNWTQVKKIERKVRENRQASNQPFADLCGPPFLGNACSFVC